MGLASASPTLMSVHQGQHFPSIRDPFTFVGPILHSQGCGIGPLSLKVNFRTLKISQSKSSILTFLYQHNLAS